ncbi:MAG: hypothetical protein INR65_07150 [Gluconacetobacter diazotrophicus]|nr:hypothetical protein [Gluconacetobacter diazotrophicus]
MYFWLVVPVVLVALWLAVGVVAGWWKRVYGWFVGLLALGGVAAAAAFVLFAFGPFWKVVYDTLLQPG